MKPAFFLETLFSWKFDQFWDWKLRSISSLNFNFSWNATSFHFLIKKIRQTSSNYKVRNPKDTIEPMKWTNELFHQFRKYQQISQKLENFLQINIFFVFSENCWTFREILGKIHQNFAEKWQNFENFREIFRKNAKKITKFFAENLRSERCKGMQIL